MGCDKMGDLTKNFNREEYACKCGCGRDNIKNELAASVQLVRDIVKRGIVITSGIRCEAHNTTIKAAPSSSHIDGFAADLAYKGSAERYQLLNAAMQVFDRVGIAKNFIHVDVDSTKSPEVVWLYS
tara:strand:- start:126 stop:503 length:378 start_codon:yes stop_codon:yes gene_type:complete